MRASATAGHSARGSGRQAGSMAARCASEVRLARLVRRQVREFRQEQRVEHGQRETAAVVLDREVHRAVERGDEPDDGGKVDHASANRGR